MREVFKKRDLCLSIILIILCCHPCQAHWSETGSDLTSLTFISADLQGWSDSRVSSCPSINTQSMIGGYSLFSAESSTQKNFDLIPPHFRARIQFTLFFIDVVNNSVASENIALKVDGNEVWNILPSSLVSSTDFCGDENLYDVKADYTVDFDHSAQSMTIQFLDNFLSGSTKSWGVRNIQIFIISCYERCASCNGDWSNQCTSCYPLNSLSSGECSCDSGYYYSNYTCIPTDPGITTCDQSLLDEIAKLVVQPISSITDDVLPKIQIVVQISFAYTLTTIPPECQNLLAANFKILNQITGQYVNLSDLYELYLQTFPTDNSILQQTYDNGVSLLVQMPVDFLSFSLASGTSYLTSLSYSLLEMEIQLGTTDSYVRDSRFQVFLASTSNPAQPFNTFSINIDDQVTDGCFAASDDCIIIADVSTQSYICSDSTCAVPRSNSIFTVGDQLFVFVQFQDPSFTKYISMDSTYFKGDNQVLNLTPLVQTLSQTLGSSIFSIPLLDSSDSCVLQLSVHISDQPSARRLRRLDDDPDNVSPSISTNTGNSNQATTQYVSLKNFTVLPTSSIIISSNSSSPQLQFLLFFLVFGLLFL